MEFFLGQREVARFGIVCNSRTPGVCSIYEEWKLIIKESIRCGASSSCKVIKRIGVSKSDLYILENKIKSKIGVDSFAALEANIKESIKQEVIFNESTETERKIEFSAPKCGRYEVEQYQLIRTIEVRTPLRRIFRKPKVTEDKVSEALPVFFDNSKVFYDDVNCNCEKQVEIKADGRFLAITKGLSFTVPYFLNSSLTIELFNNSIEIIKYSMVGMSLEVRREWLSELQQFLVDSEGDIVDVGFLPLREVKSFKRDEFPVESTVMVYEKIK